MNCPNCGEPTADDFGLVTCANCQHQFMADLDGVAPPIDLRPVEEPFDDALVEEAPPPDGFVFNEEESEPPQAAQAPPPPTPTEIGESELVVSHSEFSDVVAFANSTTSQGIKGPAVYKIRLAGLDTPEIKNELKSVLLEPRLRLDADQLLKGIKEGVLILDDLPSIKAAFIVKELISLPIEISFQQRGIFKDV